MSSRYLSPQLRENIIKHFDAGYGYKSIAKMFCIPVATAKTIRDIHRRQTEDYVTAVKEKRARYSPAFKLEMVNQFLASGMSIKTFAWKNNLCPGSLRLWLLASLDGSLLGTKEK